MNKLSPPSDAQIIRISNDLNLNVDLVRVLVETKEFAHELIKLHKNKFLLTQLANEFRTTGYSENRFQEIMSDTISTNSSQEVLAKIFLRKLAETDSK